jgi:hypothetical protein
MLKLDTSTRNTTFTCRFLQNLQKWNSTKILEKGTLDSFNTKFYASSDDE